MSLPQQLVYGAGGTVSIDVPRLPQNAQVTVLQSDGTVVIGPVAATLSAINTLLNTTCYAGDLAINVANTTGIAANSTFWLQDDPEEVLARKVGTGGTVTLRRPLLYDHVVNAVVEGTRLSYEVPAANASTLFWDGRAEWNIDGAGVTDYTAVECGKYPLRRLATAQDMADIEPQLYNLIDSEASLERLLDLAFERVLSRVATMAPDMRTRVFTGSSEFRHCTALMAWTLFYMRQRGPEAQGLYERFGKELDGELARICQVVPRDADQDGTVEIDEKASVRTVRLRRC